MKLPKIWFLLFATIATSAIIPTVSTFVLLDASLQTSLNLGFNQSIPQVLTDSAKNLKLLKKMDPSHVSEYRQQFDQVVHLQSIYTDPQFVKKQLGDSLKLYFMIGISFALLVAVLLSSLLSYRIGGAYKTVYVELQKKNEAIKALEAISSWQQFARMLAHEIKNPLTPIKLLLSSLMKSHGSMAPDKFSEQLRATDKMVQDEIEHLNRLVTRFSEFARLPDPKLELEVIKDLVQAQSKLLMQVYQMARIEVITDGTVDREQVYMDAPLFKQVLANIICNGIEANLEREVHFTFNLSSYKQIIFIKIANNGVIIPEDIAAKIFEPHVSSKSGGNNMGLGLTIARKIVLQHNGNISFHNRNGQPEFTIQLPEANHV